MMEIFKAIHLWQFESRRLSQRGQSLGFVPTMGCLHEGHFKLIETSLEQNDHTLVSIFVNPTQFEDKNDLLGYPSTIEKDISELEKRGVSYLLMPSKSDIYPNGNKYVVTENQLSRQLCGESRVGHFEGVMTVVLKLINIAQAHRAYFGEKDHQQFELIKGMAKAFFLKTDILMIPTVREQSGLALSSRNLRLDEASHKLAAKFFATLGDKNLNIASAKEQLTQLGFEVDYIEDLFGRRYGAVKLNGIRLIDNVGLKVNHE